MNEIVFTVDRDEGSACLVASWDEPDGNGGITTQGRDLSELQAMLREAVLCQPEVAEVHLSLGEALAEAGQLREALKHLGNAVQLARPDDHRPRESLKKWRMKVKPSS